MMPKQHIEPFAQLPHWVWKEQIKPFAKLMLFAIYKMTAGFHRDTWKISDAEITELTGIKAPAPIRKYLIKRKYIKYEHGDGMTGFYTIPPPNEFRHSPKLNSGDPQNKLNGYQRAKDNYKYKFKESTLSDDLVEEMKTKFPNKDVIAIKNKMVGHYEGQKVNLNYKFKQWCETERIENGAAAADFRLDSCGFPMGYCQECGVSASYYKKELYGDSRCCNSKILSAKPSV